MSSHGYDKIYVHSIVLFFQLIFQGREATCHVVKATLINVSECE